MRHPASSKPHRFPAWLGPRSLAAADGGRVTVLREGGRVIGLFPGGSNTNLLWTHHAPAIGGDTGLRQHRDVSQVWGFSGPRDAIEAITESLCGARGRG